MSTFDHLNRRSFLLTAASGLATATALPDTVRAAGDEHAMLPLDDGMTHSGARTAQLAAARGSKTLVAYFSRTGNTRVIAGQIRRARGADLFEIMPADPYPEDYEATVGQALKETTAGYRPPLKAAVSNIASYDTVFLGFPIWGMTTPPVVRSFLSKHDLAGKTVVPFITHGGYGVGQSLSVLSKHAPQARLRQPFVMEADQERRTLTLVSEWLGGLSGQK